MSDYSRNRQRQQPPLPKPYEFVPLPEGSIPKNAPAGHHSYQPERWSGSLSAQIIARSPVHIGSGLLEQRPSDATYPLVKGHFRTGGVIAIPATSLKGCIRSIAEAISRSAVQVTRAYALPRRYQPSRQPERDGVDVVQNMFGTLGYQGLLRFADAPLLDGKVVALPTPQLFRPRSESQDTYFDGTQPRGRKFYMHGALARGNLPLEACAIDSRFGLQLAFENLTSAELGLLLTALGLGEPRWWPKIGGGKPACLGTIEVTAPTLTAWQAQTAYSDFDIPHTPLETAALLAAAQTLILQEQVGRLAEILRWPRDDRNCPDRNY